MTVTAMSVITSFLLPYHPCQRYALMPSFTARPIPHRLTMTRNGPPGTFLAIFGPPPRP